MTALASGPRLRRIRQAAARGLAFLGHAEPRRPLPRSSRGLDAAIAVAATAAVLAETYLTPATARFPPGASTPMTARLAFGLRTVLLYPPVQHHELIGMLPRLPGHSLPSLPVLAAIVATTLPLAVRRRYPIAALTVMVAAIVASRGWAQPVTFAAAIFGAYSAVAYSRFRQLALLTVVTGAVIVTAAFPGSLPHVAGRSAALLVLAPTVAVAVAIREWRRRASDSADRLRRAQDEHAAATSRAIELERARIASELHDVVTHNVSVMVVQAGACRQVLDTSPADAREALLAVEASGRTAMAELRHLLGLLCPPGDGLPGQDGALAPQPGLGQLATLLRRVGATGLPVELRTTGTPAGLPPGVDLAAYRVVQEALTNVINHAGPVPTTVALAWPPGELIIDVTSAGPPGSGGAAPAPRGGAGRGLIGLRERITLYGGELDAGPRAGGGWRVRAVIPLDAARVGGLSHAPALAAPRPAGP